MTTDEREPISTPDGDSPSAPAQAEPAEEPRTETAPWWRRRRWWLAGAAGLLAVVPAAGFFVVSPFAADPEDVVTDYLEVLKAGDADAALEFAAEMKGIGKASKQLLVDEAMASDWEVTRLFRAHNEDDDPATVDVTIAAADGTERQGRFELTQTDGDWAIVNPLIKLDLSAAPMAFAEFNGVTSEEETVWLFPGAYSAYDGSPQLFNAGPMTYVATPVTSDYESREASSQVFIPLLEPDESFDDLVGAQMSDWIDQCAEESDPIPAGCPFSAGNGGSVGDDEISVGGERYDTDKVSWEVISYPRIRAEQGEAGFTIHIVTPGEVEISGTGDTYDAADQDFSGRCDIDVEGLTGRLTLDREMSFTTVASYTCSSRYE